MTATRFLPGVNVQRKVLLKALFGVFAGSVLFAVYAYVYSGFQSGLGLPRYEVGLLMIVLGALFALLPALAGTYLLLGWIQRDFHLGRASAGRSFGAGLALGVLGGLLTTFCALSGLFGSPASIGIVVIAALVGGWVGIQAFSEIKTCEENGR